MLLTQREFELGISLALPTRSDESELGAGQHLPLRCPGSTGIRCFLFERGQCKVPPSPFPSTHRTTSAHVGDGIGWIRQAVMTVLSEITMAMSLRHAPRSCVAR